MEAILDFGRGCQNLSIILWGVWGKGGLFLSPLILITWPQAVWQSATWGGGKVWGEGEGWHAADNSPQQLISLFLLVFLSAVYPAGGSIKISHVGVQNRGSWLHWCCPKQHRVIGEPWVHRYRPKERRIIGGSSLRFCRPKQHGVIGGSWLRRCRPLKREPNLGDAP